MNDLDRDSIRARCARSVTHDPPRRRMPRQVLEEIAALAAPDLDIDRYGEGPIIKSFEEEVAALLGKEAAVFMPSGTMAQGIALRIWADRRRLPVVAFHPKCHLELHEERGYQRLHGLSARLVGPPSGLMTVADVERIPEPLAALLLELPQREIGGQLPPWDDLVAVVDWARHRGIALHLDGARLWETRPFYGRAYAEIAGLFDSVYVSMYKSLGGIAGSVLAGPADFIAEARVWQRRHGGTLISMYPYVLAAKAGLAARLGRMEAYRDKAVAIAARLARLPGVEVIPDPPHINMMHLTLRGAAARLERAALEVAHETGVWIFGKVVPTDLPSTQRVELTILEGAMEIDTEEIGRLFEAVLERAAPPIH
jgi:threonine aldolase